MSRPAQIEFSDAVYNVMARGDRLEAVFRDDPDRSKFLGYLAEGAERYSTKVHCCVLMGESPSRPSTRSLFSAQECLAHFGFQLISEGFKGINNGLCFALLTYRFALTYKPNFGGIFILW